MKREDHMILAHLDKDEPTTGRIASLGKQTKSKLQKLGIEEPKPQAGFFTIPELRMDVFYPANIAENEKESFQKKMLEKYRKTVLIK